MIREDIKSFFILKLISLEPTYGYILIRRVKEMTKGELGLSPSRLYDTISCYKTMKYIENFHFVRITILL